MKLLATSKDERRETHVRRARARARDAGCISTAGNKFITSFVRYLRLCRATVLSRAGWITGGSVNVGVTRVQHAGRALLRVTPLCLLPASYIEHNTTRGRTSIFRVHVKSIWSFDIPGCRSGTIASSPCHAATASALLSGAPR